jgi:F-type H+-transporting ATPase subunit delta
MRSQAASNFSFAMVELAKERNLLEAVRNASESILPGLRLPELADFLKHPKVPGVQKKELLIKLAPSDTPREFLNFLELIIDRKREEFLIPILEGVVDLTLQAWGFEIAEIISAVPLSDAERNQITDNLEKAWDKKLFIRYREKPALIGGIIIRRGDQIIDGSLTGQIHSLRQVLLEETELPM